MHIDSLNKNFSLGSALTFRQLPSGITLIEIDTQHATASISLEGGQVLTWHPKNQVEPVLWVSKRAQFVPGKAIRGGVPICWPWFGAHPSNPNLPGHGYARITSWKVDATEKLDDETIRIFLSMGKNKLSKLHWQQEIALSIEIIIGNVLTIKLISTNESQQHITLTEGLHTYFNIADVSTTKVDGFDKFEYVDLTKSNERQVQNGPILFEAELGRIFLNAGENCVIEDFRFKRRINVEKKGSLSTAVWNPWAVTASSMSDMDKYEWRSMVCVEAANALDNFVTLAPGDSHVLHMSISADNIS